MKSQSQVATRKTHDVIVTRRGGGYAGHEPRASLGSTWHVVRATCGALYSAWLPAERPFCVLPSRGPSQLADAEGPFSCVVTSHSCSADLCRQREVCRAEPVYLQTLRVYKLCRGISRRCRPRSIT